MQNDEIEFITNIIITIIIIVFSYYFIAVRVYYEYPYANNRVRAP